MSSTSLPEIILASSSPYRREILERLGLSFRSVSPEIDESAIAGESPKQLVERLAIAKAQAIAGNLANALVIGSDQVSEQAGEILGKPKDHADAISQLRAASGSVACLYSGIAVINSDSGVIQSGVAEVEVECRDLSDDEIERYLAADKPYNCCGSLKVEGRGISLLKSIRSDDPNAITGMPVILMLQMLRLEGVVIP